jgi:glycerol-3-phosphate acyltransferase PlsY
MLTYVMVAVVAYLLGSIPFGYVLVKVFHGQDVRETFSGNIGATNVGRTSPLLGFATLLLDGVKGFLAVTFGREIYIRLPWDSTPEQAWGSLVATAALFAVLGHVFPVWLKFKGGKGVATAVGAFVALAPKAIVLVLVVFVVVVAVSRYVSLGSIVGAALFPVFVYVFNREYPVAMLLVIGAASLIIILKHHENIRRLLAGTENRLGAKRA